VADEGVDDRSGKEYGEERDGGDWKNAADMLFEGSKKVRLRPERLSPPPRRV